MKWIFGIAAALIGMQYSAAAQEAGGTLERIARKGSIALGYQVGSLPFSYVNEVGQPIGYSVDLCGKIAEAVKEHLRRPELSVLFAPITAEQRFTAVTDGTIDLMCGSVSQTLSRREKVDFTLPIYIDGAALLVRLEPVHPAGDLHLADPHLERLLHRDELARVLRVPVEEPPDHALGQRALLRAVPGAPEVEMVPDFIDAISHGPFGSSLGSQYGGGVDHRAQVAQDVRAARTDRRLEQPAEPAPGERLDLGRGQPDRLAAGHDRAGVGQLGQRVPLRRVCRERQHREIVAAIAAHDPTQAESAMQRHLRTAFAAIERIASAHAEFFEEEAPELDEKSA